MPAKRLIAILSFIAILIVYCCSYYSEMLFRFPFGTHSWAQSDRLALAISFFDNGMNFFKPATFSQFSIDGVTGVEFPLQSYIAATLGFVFGRENISTCFRLVDVIIACTGLFFLFMACFKTTKDYVFSLVPPLFIFSSPVYLFYVCNYLPDAAGASIVFIAFYFLLEYLQHQERKQFYITLAILTLAILIKTSECIYLGGFVAVILLQKISRKETDIKSLTEVILPSLLSVAMIGGYMLYNKHLNEKYQSALFLAKTVPFKDAEDFNYYINFALKYTWLDQYFTLPQYLMFLALFSGAFYFLLKTSDGKVRLLLAGIYFIGALCMLYLFGGQLTIHDYYIISILLPFFAFALVISVIAIKQYCSEDAAKALRISSISALAIVYIFGNFQFYKRIEPNTKAYIGFEYHWAEGGSKVMDELKIPKNEKILVLREMAPNTALINFDRRGYHLNGESVYHAELFMKDRQLQILVMEANSAKKIMQETPNDLKDFLQLYMSERIAVYRLH